MTTSPKRVRSLHRTSIAAALFAAVLLALAWGGVALMLQSKRADALEAEQREMANLASALTEQTLRVFAAVDQATLRTRDAVVGGAAQVDLVRFANETGLAPAILVQLSLTDAGGRFLGSNLDPDGSKSQHVDLSQREHVRVHLQRAPGAKDADVLFIGMPVLGKVSGRWTLQLSRRVTDAQGRLLGVVVASLDPSYFEAVYQRVAIGRSGAVALVGADHRARAQVVGGRAVAGGESAGARASYPFSDAEPTGRRIGLAGPDLQERITAFRRVGEHPVFVVIGTTTAEALAEWRTTRNVMLVLTGALTAVVLAAVLGFVGSMWRLENSNLALQRSQAQARAASEAKTQFLAAMSHELRTPLTSIRGFAELLEKRLPDARFRETAGLIRVGAERLNELFTDILEMTQLEAGALELKSEPVALKPLVEGAAGLFAAAAADKQLALQTQFAAGLPATLRCDGLRLRQILHNLLSNAIKFTPAGEVRLSVDADGDAGQLRFHVCDTGPGIPPEMHEAVFEMFRQGSARVSFQHGGTGLGLAFCRALAERMGGRLELMPASALQPAGAHFTLTLPAPASSSPTGLSPTTHHECTP